MQSTQQQMKQMSIPRNSNSMRAMGVDQENWSTPRPLCRQTQFCGIAIRIIPYCVSSDMNVQYVILTEMEVPVLRLSAQEAQYSIMTDMEVQVLKLIAIKVMS